MIREINDFSKIEEIFNNIFEEKLNYNIYSKLIVYEENNNIIGFCIYDIIYERCEIEYIGVLKEYRKNKIASKILEYLIDNLDENIKNITLEVSVKNEGAINLYLKYGFQKKAIRKNYYKNIDAYLMLKEV